MNDPMHDAGLGVGEAENQADQHDLDEDYPSPANGLFIAIMLVLGAWCLAVGFALAVNP